MAAQRSSNVFAIEVDGAPLGEDVADSLLEAWVEDEVNMPDTFELVFRDPLRKVLASGGFEIGKKLSIKVVSEAAAGGVAIVDAEITAVEAEIEREQTLTIVRGYDFTHRLQRGTKTETHLDSTYGDIAGRIAGRHKLSKGDGGTSTVIHEAVVQWNQTDWEFLTTLASESGHEVVVADGKLHFRQPGDSGSAPQKGDLESDGPRQLVAGGNLLKLRATVSGTEQVEEVTVRGWDYKTKEAVEATARAGNGARSAAAGQGAADLAEKLGGGTLVKVDLPVSSAEVAQEAADSLVEQLGSSATELDGVAFGNPELRAGVTVSVANVGAPFDGKYVLTSVRHTYDPTNGFLSSFRVCGRQNRTMLGLVNGSRQGDRLTLSGVVSGIVSNIDDPEQLGRMKVTFPWLAESTESPWARVAMAGAGAKRGMVMLPEVGDEVIVAFDHGDARLPYVIGGLYNGKDELPVEAVKGGQVVKRAIVARNNHRLEFDDDADKVTIATGDGKHSIVLDQKGNKIVITTTGDIEVGSDANLTVKAPSGFSLETSGDFKLKATNVTIEASANLTAKGGATAKVEGGASAELKGGATTTVSGGIVKIN